MNRIEEALDAIRRGKMVIVADDDDREAEGDFIMAASLVRDEDVNLMASRGRGLICCSISPKIAASLKLSVQTGALHDTPFTESLDYRHGTTTGISCADRAAGMRALATPGTKPEDFARPGHLFPLVAREGGVLERRGHTEAALDLCRLAGLPEAGVICEIMNPNGTMARGPQLKVLAKELGMVFLRVEDIALYRQGKAELVAESSTAVAEMPSGDLASGLGPAVTLPTAWGTFSIQTFRNAELGVGPLSLTTDGSDSGLVTILSTGLYASDGSRIETEATQPLLVRIHSACHTGDVFGSMRCDCGPQLHEAMRLISQEGRGAIVYLPQEGRGIGLEAKLRAYALQEKGMDTLEANRALGFPDDARTYEQAVAALTALGVETVRLLTNNPDKVRQLSAGGIQVVERVGIRVGANKINQRYLETKRLRSGHDLPLPTVGAESLTPQQRTH